MASLRLRRRRRRRQAVTIPRGARLRGDHPAVLGCPAYFAKADASAEEVPNLWDHVVEAPQMEPEFHHPAPPIPDEEAVTCTTTFQIGLGGRKVVKGERLRPRRSARPGVPGFFALITPLTKSSAPTL